MVTPDILAFWGIFTWYQPLLLILLVLVIVFYVIYRRKQM
jgi:hypothetical protein